MKDLGRRLPTTVQIAPGERTSIVTVDDSVRVEHRNDLEDDALSEVDSLLAITSDKFEEALHDKTGIRLSWMYACSYNYELFVLV